MLVLENLNQNKISSEIPIWFMRQAGRYLPEYLEIRRNFSSFLDLCYTPKSASEITIQPLKRFNIDAAIIFSDILVIPDALGVKVNFIEGKGPILKEISTEKDYLQMSFNSKKLENVYEALEITKSKLNKNISLIGFAGAPWTIASYMIEGKYTRDFFKVKKMLIENPDLFFKIIDLLVTSIAKHLISQIESGADVLQIFDSWSGEVSENFFSDLVIKPTQKIISLVKEKHKNIPIIGFPRGSGVKIIEYSKKSGVDAVSIDQFTPIKWASENLNLPIQGNLDPIVLSFSKEMSIQHTKNILNCIKDRKFIFNLGHGIIPSTPVENVEKVIEVVKNFKY